MTLGGLIPLLLGLLVLALVVYVAKLILDMLPLPEPAKLIAYIVIAIIFLLMLFQMIGIRV